MKIVKRFLVLSLMTAALLTTNTKFGVSSGVDGGKANVGYPLGAVQVYAKNVTLAAEKIVKVTSIKMSQTNISLLVGTTNVLRADVLPENATDNSVIWVSSNSEVAAVDEKGMVTALSAGNATIIAISKDGYHTANCSVTVATPVNSLELNKTTDSLVVGTTDILKAIILPTDATNKEVTWASNDNSVATVDSNGKVTALKSGVALITAMTKYGSYIGSCVVTITNPVTSVELNKTTDYIYVGQNDTLVANILPTDADNKSVTWTSSDSTIAAVDGNGTITALNNGNALITVTTKDGGKTASCNVTVSYPVVIRKPVTAIGINKTTDSLLVGDTDSLSVTISPAYATNKEVTWTSSNNAVISVDYSGKITAVGPGNSTIIATSKDNNMTAACYVQVGMCPDNTDITSKFTDANFKSLIYQYLGKDYSDPIYYSDVKNIEYLYVSYENITSLNGIEYFTDLIELYCEENQLTKLDLSKNTNLRELDCGWNQLTTLDLSNNPELLYLYCAYNQLTSLNVSKNKNLVELYCYGNQLSTLDVSSNTVLLWLYCGNNQLTNLDLRNNTVLLYLNCAENHLTTLDLSKNNRLYSTYCNYNEISTIYLSEYQPYNNIVYGIQYTDSTHTATTTNVTVAYKN